MKACVSVFTRAREWKKEREVERKDERERRKREREKKKKKGEKNPLKKNKVTKNPFFVFGLEGKKKGIILNKRSKKTLY